VSEQPEASDEEAEDSEEESEDSDEESEDSEEESSSESDDSDDMVRQDTGPKQAACLYSGVQDVKWAHVSHPKSMLFTYGMSGPAVGSYSPKPIVKKTRTHAFGKTKVVRKQRCYGLNRHTPGPGSYGTVFSSFTPKRSAGWGKSTTSRFGTPKCYGMSVRKPLRNTRMGKPKYGYMAPTKLTQIRHSSLHGTPAPAPKRRRAAAKPASANKRSARKPKKLPKKIKPKRAPAVVKTKKTRKPKSPKKHRPTLPRITEEESNSESEEESEGAESEEKSEEAEAEAEESEEESEESAEESEEESEESEEESEESSDDSGSGSDCDDMSDMDSILALIASHGL